MVLIQSEQEQDLKKSRELFNFAMGHVSLEDGISQLKEAFESLDYCKEAYPEIRARIKNIQIAQLKSILDFLTSNKISEFQQMQQYFFFLNDYADVVFAEASLKEIWDAFYKKFAASDSKKFEQFLEMLKVMQKMNTAQINNLGN